MANRLIDSTSPYLLQHATNPVDWYPWGPEALARAKAEQKPIFLSIGYAACHWCHVMEHLVFERGDIAALMNQHFINIKVDREERPDLDDLYMLATQLMTGQGGWPMSVWLTPELEPFYAGTYFPPEDAHGRPGFPRLLLALSEAWTNKRGELLNQSHRVVEAIRMHANEGQPATAGEHADASLPVRHWLHQAVDESSDRFDDVNGGLGGAPKFPPHQHLMLWLELAAREEGLTLLGFDAREALGGKITKTLDGMMNGGIYDHVGGGFARYSTDEKWLVPHFEKMLYDSAQLAPIYAMASVAFGRPEYARVARETLDFFLREMRSPEGAFYSSLDADSEGEEGKYYVWTLEDVRAALPDATEADRVIRHFGMTSEGNWHESPVRGGSVLAVPEGVTPDAALPALLERMRAYRAKRIAPRLDDKILTAWNGLMLSALAICGSRLKEERYLRAARELADFLLTRHVMSGQLLRVSRGGPAHTPAFLDDHAYLLNGLLDLAEADAESEKYLAHATTIARLMISNFSDEGAGGFFFTGAHHEQLFARMKNAADNATPSANGIAIWALLRLARALGDDTFRRPALRAVQAFHANIDRRPEYFPTLLRGLFDDLAGHDMPAEARRPHLPMAGRADKGVVQFSVTGVAPDEAAEEIAFDVTFRVGIAAGYHIQSTDAAEKGIMQTTARLRALGRTRLASQAWKFPPPSSNGYAGTIEVKAKAVLANPDAGKHSFRATLMAQPCSEVACLEPVTVTTEFILDMS